MESLILPGRRGPRELAPSLTPHAYRRACQRGIRVGEIALAISYGRAYRRCGAHHFFFGHREARDHSHALVASGATLAGLVVVVSADLRYVLTTYRRARPTRR